MVTLGRSPRFEHQRSISPRRTRPRPYHQHDYPNHLKDTLSSSSVPLSPQGMHTGKYTGSASLLSSTTHASPRVLDATLHRHRIQIVSPITNYNQQRRGATKCLQAHTKLRGHLLQKRTPSQDEEVKKLVNLLFHPAMETNATTRTDIPINMTKENDSVDSSSSEEQEQGQNGLLSTATPTRPKLQRNREHFGGKGRLLKIHERKPQMQSHNMRSPKSLNLKIDMTLKNFDDSSATLYYERAPAKFLARSPVFRHRLEEADSSSFFDTLAVIYASLRYGKIVPLQ